MWWTTATVRSNQRKTKQSYLTVFGLLQYVLQLHGHLDAALVLVSTFGSLTSTQTYQTMWWTQYRRTPLCQSTLSKRGKQTWNKVNMIRGSLLSVQSAFLTQGSHNPLKTPFPSWFRHSRAQVGSFICHTPASSGVIWTRKYTEIWYFTGSLSISGVSAK